MAYQNWSNKKPSGSPQMRATKIVKNATKFRRRAKAKAKELFKFTANRRRAWGRERERERERGWQKEMFKFTTNRGSESMSQMKWEALKRESRSQRNMHLHMFHTNRNRQNECGSEGAREGEREREWGNCCSTSRVRINKRKCNEFPNMLNCLPNKETNRNKGQRQLRRRPPTTCVQQLREWKWKSV